MELCDSRILDIANTAILYLVFSQLSRTYYLTKACRVLWVFCNFFEHSPVWPWGEAAGTSPPGRTGNLKLFNLWLQKDRLLSKNPFSISFLPNKSRLFQSSWFFHKPFRFVFDKQITAKLLSHTYLISHVGSCISSVVCATVLLSWSCRFESSVRIHA